MRKNQLLESILASQLAKENFVVVPGFGAFICKEIPAQISNKGFILTPPTKEIVFNTKVVASDGVIEQELVLRHKLSYGKADEYVRKTVANWHNQIETRGQFTLPNIGVFASKNTGVVEFKAFRHANFLPTSFGLEIAKAYPLEQQNIETQKDVNQATESKTIVIEKIPVSYQRFKRISIAAIVILSVSATYLYMLSFNPNAVERAGLNFFDVPIIADEDLERLEEAEQNQDKAEKLLDESSKKADSVLNKHNKVNINTEESNDPEKPVADNKIEKEIEAAVAEKETPEKEISDPVKTKEKPNKAVIPSGHYVIASSVKKQEQANSEVKRLRLKGFEPKVLEMNGKFRISVGYFATKDSANIFKQNILNDNNIETWVHTQNN